MEQKTKETLLNTIKNGAQILNAQSELGSDEDKKVFASIKEKQNFVMANELHELNVKKQELTLELVKAKQEHDLSLESSKFEHSKAMEIRSKELEEKKLELEEKKLDLDARKIDNEAKKLALEEKNAMTDKKKCFWNKAFKVAGGIGKAVVTLIPVGLYVWCYTNDTYYERYENGIARHGAKEIMREVLKPVKLDK